MVLLVKIDTKLLNVYHVSVVSLVRKSKLARGGNGKRGTKSEFTRGVNGKHGTIRKSQLCRGASVVNLVQKSNFPLGYNV